MVFSLPSQISHWHQELYLNLTQYNKVITDVSYWFVFQGIGNRILQNQIGCTKIEQPVQYNFHKKKRRNVAGFPCNVLLDLKFDEWQHWGVGGKAVVVCNIFTCSNWDNLNPSFFKIWYSEIIIWLLLSNLCPQYKHFKSFQKLGQFLHFRTAREKKRNFGWWG